MSYLARRYKFGILIVFCLVTILFNFNLVDHISVKPDYKSKCNFEMAKYVVENLCDLYLNQNLIIGDMCPGLCNKNSNYKSYEDNSKNKYQLVGCYNSKQIENQFSRNVFKTVLVYEQISTEPNQARKKFVLKSRHQSYLDFDTHMDFNFQDKQIKDQLNYLLNYIRSALYTNFGVSVHKDAIESLAKQSFKRDETKKDLHYYVKQLSARSYKYFEEALEKKDTKKLELFIKNLVVLLYQEEYLFYSYFKDKPETLNISGTCGNFYAVEHAESLSHNLGSMSSSERFNVASKFLKLIQNLDKTYLVNSISNAKSLEVELASNGFDSNKNLAEPLQVCDVKIENFGLNDKNQLKIIDTDMVRPNSYLFQAKYCNKHEDCHFFECKSYCEKNHCIPFRINNNLQAVCENIFDNKLKQEALLTSVNDLDSDLKRLINRCKFPGIYHNSYVPIAANESLILKFKRYLV